MLARCRPVELEHVDLVKLDTETTEPDVLAGMGSILSEQRPDIICEVLDRADLDALTAILEEAGYEFYHLTEKGPERRDRIVPHGRWLNYLFTVRSGL